MKKNIITAVYNEKTGRFENETTISKIVSTIVTSAGCIADAAILSAIVVAASKGILVPIKAATIIATELI